MEREALMNVKKKNGENFGGQFSVQINNSNKFDGF